MSGGRFSHHFVVQMVLILFPVVFASLQPPATLCQPSGLMPASIYIKLLQFKVEFISAN